MGLNFRKKLWSYFILLKNLEVCMCEGVCVSPSIFYTISCLLSFTFVLLTLSSNISVPGDTYNHALLNYKYCEEQNALR